MGTLLLACCLSAADPAEVTVRAVDEAGLRVEVRRLLSPAEQARFAEGETIAARDARRLLVFRLRDAAAPLFGKYKRAGRWLVFTPRRPLVYGHRYAAVAPDRQSTAVLYTAPPRPPTAAPVVERIYPTADRLPANHLKFYIHFSKPMREGREVFDHFALLDQQGEPVHDPWRRTELWSKDAKRLTLWIHPGRVKQGVNLREDFGPVLSPGKKYRLVVGAGLRDATGQHLAKPFVKVFTAGPADHARPLPSRWRVRSPRDPDSPLEVRLLEPLDHPLLFRFLRVVDHRGRGVAGKIEVADQERVWRFRPARPWPPGVYEIQVSPLLEDLAGNTPIRVFDTDLAREAVGRANLFVPFQVK